MTAAAEDTQRDIGQDDRQLTLAAVDWPTRLRLHLFCAAAAVFLALYGKIVCPFINGVSYINVLAGLAIIVVFQIALREALMRLFPAGRPGTPPGRHGLYLSMLGWGLAGIAAVVTHAVRYPDFPVASHLKLLTGYWALGAGILAQFEFVVLERYFRRIARGKPTQQEWTEHISRRLLEGYAVFAIVPSLMLVLLMFRFVYQGHASSQDAMEVVTVGVILTGMALLVAWRYGMTLRQDCKAIREALGYVAQGDYGVRLDSTRPDDLGLVSRSINQMNRALIRREQRELRLLESTSAISQELNLERLLTKIMHWAAELLGAERATLYLYDPKRDVLWSRVAVGLTSEVIELRPGEGLAGSCFASGAVIIIDDAYADPRFSPEVDRKSGYKTANMLCMPIETKEGKRLGIVQIINKQNGSFGKPEERALRSLVAQAATAIENAQMFEDILTMRNYNENILTSLSNGVITVDCDLKLTKVNRAALNLFEWQESEVLEADAARLLAGENAWLLKIAERVMTTGERDYSLDVDVVSAQGRTVSINLGMVPLRDAKNVIIGVMLVIEDLSNEKRVRNTMSRYMPKGVIDRVLDGNQAVLEGSAQDVTALFTDIRNFTSISEDIGARNTVLMLNEYFGEMIDALHANNGVLDKYIGDSMMALFGVPFGSPQDAQNAVIAANEMMIALEALNRRRAQKALPAIHHGVGINSGEVIAGNIGSSKRMDYTVIGDAVNLAARLESATKFYSVSILVSEMTYEQLVDKEHFRELDILRVKGRSKPVKIFEAYAFRAHSQSEGCGRSIALQRDGMAAFRKRDWRQAERLFLDARDHDKEDTLPPIYLQRIQHYMTSPPPDDWDGVWTMQTK